MTAVVEGAVEGAVDQCTHPAAGPQRKRGAALEEAILEAAFAELSEVGYTAFSVEAVAARARTGKASIYRRWPSKQELVLDTLVQRLPTAEQCGLQQQYDDSVTTADALRQIACAITEILASPAGDAMRSIKCEAYSDPELARAIDERFQAPRREAMLHLLHRGVERGEVRPDAVDPLIADVLPAVLSFRIVLQREALDRTAIVDIIEKILIPLVSVQ